MNTVEGIDTSVYEPISSYVGLGDRLFMAFRCTVGDYYRDPTFLHNWSTARTNGKLRSAYHVVRADVAPARQILGDGKNYGLFSFLKLTNEPGFGELPISLDVEVLAPGKGLPNFTKSQQVAATGECARLVRQETGKDPLLYTAKWFTDAVMGSTDWPFGQFDHWLAGYPWDKVQTNLSRLPSSATLSHIPVPRGLPPARIKFWQYTEKGKLPGMTGDFDLDVFLGTPAELYAYAGTHPVAVDWVQIALSAATAKDVAEALRDAGVLP